MERCPNCGAQVREGAKFCTTCGQRFGDGEPESAATDAATDSLPDQSPREEDAVADHAVAAWPSPRAADEARDSEGWTWQPAPVPPTSPEPVPPQDEATIAATSEPPREPWVTAPDSGAATPGGAEPFPSPGPEVPTALASEPVNTLERVDQMLAELRRIVASSPATSRPDLSGVISELEVAITAPAALPTDELNELREAIFAARERPRDLDTAIDLTRRVDALVTLVIAYDRTVAAIERALDVLSGPDVTGAS